MNLVKMILEGKGDFSYTILPGEASIPSCLEKEAEVQVTRPNRGMRAGAISTAVTYRGRDHTAPTTTANARLSIPAAETPPS